MNIDWWFVYQAFGAGAGIVALIWQFFVAFYGTYDSETIRLALQGQITTLEKLIDRVSDLERRKGRVP